MSKELDNAFDTIVGVIERHIEPVFKPGVKLTVIARTPGNDEADMLVTSDTIEGLQALLQRSANRAISHDNKKKGQPQ